MSNLKNLDVCEHSRSFNDISTNYDMSYVYVPNVIAMKYFVKYLCMSNTKNSDV